MKPSNEKERREYFRVDTDLFLRIHSLKENKQFQKLEEPIAESTILLKQFVARLDYDQPEGHAYWKDLAIVVLKMGEEFSKNSSPFLRKRVSLSGSGMSFTWDKIFEENEKIEIEMGFTDYPHRVITMPAKILRSFSVSDQHKGYIVIFEPKRESDRDLIIRFVNTIQRLPLK